MCVTAKNMLRELSRLQCACAFSEGAQRLEALLEEASLVGGGQKKLAKLKAAVSELRHLHEAHVAEYGPAYGRSLLELSKVQMLNPIEGQPFATTTYGAKELLAYRDPPKKRTKKQETQDRKKRKTQSTSAALSSSVKKRRRKKEQPKK